MGLEEMISQIWHSWCTGVTLSSSFVKQTFKTTIYLAPDSFDQMDCVLVWVSLADLWWALLDIYSQLEDRLVAGKSGTNLLLCLALFNLSARMTGCEMSTSVLLQVLPHPPRGELLPWHKIALRAQSIASLLRLRTEAVSVSLMLHS